MNNRALIFGIIIGLITNTVGLIVASLILGKNVNVIEVLSVAKSQGFLGKLISLGALLNLAAFDYFLRKRMDSQARGVLVATILVAIFTYIFNFL